MRGAGSTYNDIVDREIDAKVERTRLRPLASGRVSLRAAIVFLVLQCLVGLGVLLSFNGVTIALGLASPLIVLIYPFAKRFTSWPQAVLGLAFAYGALLGWTALTGRLAWPAIFLYASAILWTIGFDTIYALQDKRDDAIAGRALDRAAVRRACAPRRRRALSGFRRFRRIRAACRPMSAASRRSASPPMRRILPGRSIVTSDAASPEVALMLFRSNRDAGLLLFAGLAAQAAIRAYS